MKRLFLLALLFVGSVVHAQKGVWGSTEADSVNCWQNYNIFGSNYNSKSYLEAYESWSYVYKNCPQAKENIFVFGPTIVREKIKATTDETQKKALIAQLMEVYDLRNQYWPGKEAFVLGSKGYDYIQFYPEDPKTAFALFQTAMQKGSTELTPQHLNGYFLAAIRLVKDKSIEIPQLFEVYNQVNEALEYHTDKLNKSVADLSVLRDSGTLDPKSEKELARNEKLLEGYDKVAGNIEKSIAPVLSCDRLKAIYNLETFEANKTDEVWLNRANKMLAKERQDENGNTVDCTDNPVFYKTSEALYAINPDALAARSMGRLAVVNEKWAEATKYFTDAIALEVDPRKKGADYLRLASIQQKMGQFAAAKQSAMKAIALNKEDGRGYLVIAGIYASAAGTCGDNVFEKNAVYWAAIDYATKAKSVDATLTKQADALIANFKKGIPDKSIAFQFNKKDGDRYTIGCWINETVTVRFY